MDFMKIVWFRSNQARGSPAARVWSLENMGHDGAGAAVEADNDAEVLELGEDDDEVSIDVLKVMAWSTCSIVSSMNGRARTEELLAMVSYRRGCGRRLGEFQVSRGCASHENELREKNGGLGLPVPDGNRREAAAVGGASVRHWSSLVASLVRCCGGK
jgi:hypothetical protein